MQEQGDQLLGNWRVVREIGRGGMGVVHLAEHRFIPDKRAAMKVLLPELSRERAVTDRFFKEAVASSRIRHPGIVEVFDCGFAGDTAYLVMEYCEGENLAAWLQSGLRRVSLAEVVGISRQIATALEAAHRVGIVHRDLKPENVFLLPRPDGPAVKVLDFGIARLMAPKGDPRLTRQGSILGTPRYMSPEQCRGDIDVDGRADVYALGCIMFELVCGRPPFVSTSEGELLAAHMTQPPPDPAPFAPSFPPALPALILRALAKDPAQRPASMAALETELASVAEPPRGGDTIALPPPAPTVVLPNTSSPAPAAVAEPEPEPAAEAPPPAPGLLRRLRRFLPF